MDRNSPQTDFSFASSMNKDEKEKQLSFKSLYFITETLKIIINYGEKISKSLIEEDINCKLQKYSVY